MKLNKIEKFLMNNPIREAIQRWYETPLLQDLGGDVKGLNVLEIGCGRGVATEILLERFEAAHVHAVDLDPDMIAKARTRLAAYPQSRLTLQVADVTALDLPDASVDAVFEFAILHHVEDWQAGVAEIRRVLKPGGRFFFQDVTRHALDKLFYRLFMQHPQENRFDAEQFVRELERHQLVVGTSFVERNGGDFIFGVGQCVRAEANRRAA